MSAQSERSPASPKEYIVSLVFSESKTGVFVGERVPLSQSGAVYYTSRGIANNSNKAIFPS